MECEVRKQKSDETLARLRDSLRGLTALDRGRTFRDLHMAGYTHSERAQAAGCSEPLVRQLIKLAKLPATLLEEYEAGEIGRKQALQRAKKLQEVEPPRWKNQTRIKRSARALEEWVRTEVPFYACARASSAT